MRKCPKCSRQYDDPVRICRTCGSFLETVAEANAGEGANSPTPLNAEESLPVLTLMEEETPMDEERTETSASPLVVDGPLPQQRSWPCPQCHQAVPSTFDVCWNCGTNRAGTPDPSFVAEPPDLPDDVADDAVADDAVADEEPESREDEQRHDLRCPRCGSSHVIPEARIVDQGQHSDGNLKVVVYGNPAALVFKDRLYGRLVADICGACGHVELQVENPEELYEHYRQTAK